MDRQHITVSSGIGVGIIIFFFALWWQSGWYRIDCALGSAAACALIEEEYAILEMEKGR